MLAHAEARPELSAGSVSSTSGAFSATAACWAEVERRADDDEEHAWRGEDVAGGGCVEKKSSTTAAEEPFFRFRGRRWTQRVDEDGFRSRFMPTGPKLNGL